MVISNPRTPSGLSPTRTSGLCRMEPCMQPCSNTPGMPRIHEMPAQHSLAYTPLQGLHRWAVYQRLQGRPNHLGAGRAASAQHNPPKAQSPATSTGLHSSIEFYSSSVYPQSFSSKRTALCRHALMHTRCACSCTQGMDARYEAPPPNPTRLTRCLWFTSDYVSCFCIYLGLHS
jgi:hypothetical protein